MKTIPYYFIILFTLSSLFLFGQRTEFYPTNVNLSNNIEQNIYEFPFEEKAPFYTVCLNIENTGLDLSDFQIRFSKDGHQWKPWKNFEKDIHGDDNEQISNLLYADSDTRYYQLRNSLHTPVALRIDLFNPGISSKSSISNTVQRDGCLHPPYKNRKAWCSSCPAGGSITTSVTHLVVHHSAGVNESSDWDAVVRGIWNYHVNSRGWDDVGYNWLIAPNGTLYEGRLDNIQGAHYCAKNGHTMGTCMMGNYMEIPAKDTAIATLVKLLAWKADVNNIDPLGSSYHPATGGNLKNIIGHRDGCNTSCPGDKFYPVLHAQVKPKVDELIKNKCKDQVVVDPDPDPDPVESHYKGVFKIRPSLVQDKIQFLSGRKIIHPIKVYIVNMTGQIVFSTSFTGKYEYFEEKLDVSFLPAGVYYMKLIYGISDKEFKFVKI